MRAFTTDDHSIVPLVIQVSIGITLVLVLAYVLVKIFRLAVRWIRWTANQSNANVTINLICFAIAVVIFPQPLNFIVSKGWEALLNAVKYTPILLQQLSVMQNSCSDWTCLSVVFNFFIGFGAFLSKILSDLELNAFPFTSAILMTATWLGLANILNWVAVAEHLTSATQAVGAASVRGLGSISPTFRDNFLFFVVLALGLYLSFSSVIAIPSLQEADTQDRLKPEELKSRLEGVALTIEEFKKRFPDIEKSMQILS